MCNTKKMFLEALKRMGAKKIKTRSQAHKRYVERQHIQRAVKRAWEEVIYELH